MHKKLALLNVVAIVALLLGLVLTTGALAQGDIQTAAESYFSGGTKNIKATDLYDNLNDGDPENDPFILSVRSAEDYAKGHIPGAVNISAKELFTDENLAKLPTDKQIVVYCYTGQTASHVTSALNMLGYDAYNLLFGFSSWTNNADAYVKRFNPDKHAHDYTVETEANEATETYDLPTPLGADIKAAANAYFSGGTKNIKADALYENLNDGDPENDPFILSVRSADDYAKGHIPGAVNISAKELFKADNLKKLPPDKQIVVYCYTGQTASQVTSALNMLGYDAYNLLFGMSSWTTNPDVYVKRFDPAKHAHDYSFEGTATAGAEAGAEAGTTQTMPVTGGIPLETAAPVGLIIFGLVSLGAGLILGRRKAA